MRADVMVYTYMGGNHQRAIGGRVWIYSDGFLCWGYLRRDSGS